MLYVVDGSGSVRKRNFEKIKQFTQELSGRFDIGSDKTRVAFMQFGRASKTRLEFGLGEENTLSDVNKAINRIKYLRSRTETGDALRRAREVISANILNDFVSAHLYTLFVCLFFFGSFVFFSCFLFTFPIVDVVLVCCYYGCARLVCVVGCRHGWFGVCGVRSFVCLFCLFIYLYTLQIYTKTYMFTYIW